MRRYSLPEVECYTINLLPKWCELNCEGDKIDEFLIMVEQWYHVNFDKNSLLVWSWAYEPGLEYNDAGVVGITFNSLEYADEFREIFGYVEQR